MNYKLGSLFDGSGGFPLAGSMCGIEPRWASEVEPYPIAVTRERFPNMKHLGDISKINGATIEPVDIITFGSPCQDLSVAGKRAGLKHEVNGDEETTRSGLFMEAVRIIKEMRKATDGKYPNFALWENVPGAFSSNKGEDFRIVLEELIKIVEPSAVMPPVPKNGWAYADSYIGDGWSLAYRVFDAQYWGVPQRRRRIHLVVDFRGERAQEVLFERQGLRGYIEAGRTPWKAAASDAERGSGTNDREGESDGEQQRDAITLEPGIAQREGGHIYEGVSGTLRANAGDNQMAVAYGVEQSQDAVPYTLKIRSGCDGGGKGALVQENKSATLATNNDQYLFQPICMATQQGGAEIRTDDKAPTITAAAGMSGNNQPVVCYDARGNGDGQTVSTLTGDHENRITDYSSVVVEPVPIHDQATRYAGKRGDKSDGKGNGLGVGHPGDPMNTLTSADRHAVAYAMQGFGDYKESETSSGLKARDYKDATDLVVAPPIVLDRAFFNQGQNAQYDPQFYTDGTVPTLVARGPAAVAVRYIVRRLTPTECARLQGFADRWGHIEQKTALTDEEYQFWLEVRNTHATINGKETKDYTPTQMLTWYNKLWTDSAEYKMWGNGIALPPALYCMQGIVEALNSASDPQQYTLDDIMVQEQIAADHEPIVEPPIIPENTTPEKPTEEQPAPITRNNEQNEVIISMTAREILEKYDAFLFDAPNFDDAIIGISAEGQAIYDYDTMVRILMECGDATEQEAADFVDSVTIKSVRFIRDKKKPIIMHRLSIAN